MLLKSLLIFIYSNLVIIFLSSQKLMHVCLSHGHINLVSNHVDGVHYIDRFYDNIFVIYLTWPGCNNILIHK